MTTLFDNDYRALVIGASGAIGQAFVSALQNDGKCVHLQQVSRALCPGFDLLDEGSVAAQAAACAASGPYHLVVDTTGALTIEGVGPEKSLAALQPGQLAKAFALNAIGPAMLLRHFAPLLAPGPCIYAKLSARVGSISDNHKGGWYGYRASKAALNMLLQTAAIELQRKNPQLRVVALQPGTVRSELSRPFAAGVAKLLEPADSVAGMLAALRNLQPPSGAHFVDYQGQPIPW
ncbi:short-chain dehydrogenase [Rhodoferax lacus]|uniref:Short-chain dehydrogenase n=1 Tax=Rhodoferax lacus TaxID=2184758 RepID=A0A3E1R8J5_9BURK|nr:SDR family NAD(P)-dependent oxidoreductase [Rhodoferax lacus]RFO95685.1 short-chain dehydrogenase [Rhodoferax lacus]